MMTLILLAGLQGVLNRPCYTIDSDTLQSQIAINGEQWSWTHTAFEDDKCQKAYLVFQMETTASSQTPQLDLKVREVSYTTLSDQVTRALNEIAYCGFHDWKTEQKKIVSGKTCEDFKAPSAGQVIYSTMKIEEGPLRLYVGHRSDGHDGNTPAGRFQELDDQPYAR